MGKWKNVAPGVGEKMTPAQRLTIISLREQHDGAKPGTYSGDHLPNFTKAEAGRHIDDLMSKVKAKRPTYSCQMCALKLPHDCR